MTTTLTSLSIVLNFSHSPLVYSHRKCFNFDANDWIDLLKNTSRCATQTVIVKLLCSLQERERWREREKERYLWYDVCPQIQGSVYYVVRARAIDPCFVVVRIVFDSSQMLFYSIESVRRRKLYYVFGVSIAWNRNDLNLGLELWPMESKILLRARIETRLMWYVKKR